MEEVDIWDRPGSDLGTVSNLIRRYTAQWGLPPMADEAVRATNQVSNVPHVCNTREEGEKFATKATDIVTKPI